MAVTHPPRGPQPPENDDVLWALDQDGLEPSSLSLGRRLLLRVAGVEIREMLSASERRVYATIGVFVCFFLIYAALAYYAFFARIGITDIGSRQTGIALAAAPAAVIAIMVALFDRLLVSYIPVFPRPRRRGLLRRAGSGGEAPRRRIVAPLLGRLAFAVLIGFFATQTIESYVFSKAIDKERVADRRAQLQKGVAAAIGEQGDAISRFQDRSDEANTELEARRVRYRAAREGQGSQRCRTGVCPALRQEYREQLEVVAKLVPPTNRRSRYAKAVKAAQAKVTDFDPKQDVPRSSDPLDDVTLLYRYLGTSPWALVLYVVFMALMLGLDTAAILIKYSLARDTLYERRVVARHQALWELTRERLAYARARAQNRLDTSAAEDAIEEAVVREAFARNQASAAVVAAADGHAVDALVTRIDRRPADPHAGATGASGATGATPTSGPGPVGGTAPAPSPGGGDAEVAQTTAALQLLGVSAGLVVLMYALGGCFLYSQLRKASLPVDLLWTMPPGHVLVTGATLALGMFAIALVVFAVFKLAERWSLSRGTGSGAADDAAQEAAAAAAAEPPARHKRKSRPPTARAELPAPVHAPPAERLAASTTELGASALLAGSGIAATGVGLEDLLGLGAIAGFGTGVFGLLVVAGAWIVGLLMLLRRNGALKRMTATVLAILFAFVAVWTFGAVHPMKLATVTIRLTRDATFLLPDRGASAKHCVTGGFVGHDAGGVYLIDGTHHQMRFLPDSGIAAMSVSSEPVRVVGETIRTTGCGTAFAIATTRPRVR